MKNATSSLESCHESVIATPAYTSADSGHDEYLAIRPLRIPRRGQTWTYNGSEMIRGTHAVEFSKTVAPLGRGSPLVDAHELEALRYEPTRLAPSALPGEPVQDHRVGRRRI